MIHKSVVILGASGMLGHMVANELNCDFNVYPSYRRLIADSKIMFPNAFLFDASEEHAIRSIPACDFVINCIGAIPQAAATAQEMTSINAVFPHRLVLGLTQRGTHVIHVTTDCVFSGVRGMYTENDNHDANDWYGVTKSVGEPARSAMCIRTSIVGPELRSPGVNLFDWAKSQSGKKINGYINHFWNGVTTKYLASVFGHIIKNDLYCPGIYHIFSPSRLTKFEMLMMFNRQYNLDLDITPVEGSCNIDRTLSTVTDFNDQLNVPDFKEMLCDLKQDR